MGSESVQCASTFGRSAATPFEHRNVVTGLEELSNADANTYRQQPGHVFGDSDSGTDEAASDNNPAEHMQVRQGPLEPTSLAGLTTRYGHQAG